MAFSDLKNLFIFIAFKILQQCFDNRAHVSEIPMEVHPLQSFPSSETGISFSLFLSVLFNSHHFWLRILFVVLYLFILLLLICARCECLGRGLLRLRKADEVATAVMMMEVKKEVNQSENDEVSTPVLPSINLGLQIGTNSAGSRNERNSIVRRSRESILTAGQLQELEQQVLIHKYLAAGVRVPTHLLVPIWKSAARTLGSNINGIYESYRSCKRV